MQSFRYAKPQVAVHWLAAALIIFLLATGTLVLAGLPNTAEKVGSLLIHMTLGGLAGMLVIARIVMRKRLPSPPVLPGEKLARAGHMALNLVILLMAASGMMLVLQSGLLDVVFGSGVLPENFKVFTPRKIHGLVSRLAMGLIALHVLAALYHQFVTRDGLLRRMSFGGK
jgi:cytochrome b561